MPHTRPLLSIVVPTRNRHEYVISCIRNVLRWGGDDIELVVHDNSDGEPLTAATVPECSDKRMVYRHCKKQLSMAENYEAGSECASGRYLAFLGDDDGILPSLRALAAWAEDERIEALVPKQAAQYVWPDLTLHSDYAAKPGEIRYTTFSGVVRRASCEESIRKCVTTVGQRFFDLPRPYHGIVWAEAIARLRKRAGRLFSGHSPDMAGAIGLATVIKECVLVDAPGFMPGSSARSNAGLSGLGLHVGRLCEQGHLPPGVEDQWSELVPSFYSVETMWAESVVSAARACGRQDALSRFNTALLLGLCLARHPRRALETLAVWTRVAKGSIREAALLSLRMAAVVSAEGLGAGRGYVGGLLRRAGLRERPSGWMIMDGGKDIDEAVNRYVASHGGGSHFVDEVRGRLSV